MRLNMSRRLMLACAAISILAMAGCSHKRAKSMMRRCARPMETPRIGSLTAARIRSSASARSNRSTSKASASSASHGLTTSKRCAGWRRRHSSRTACCTRRARGALCTRSTRETGKLLWQYDPKVPKDHDKYVCCDVVNRGVALYKGRVYVATLDGRLIALDAKTGAPVWDVQTTPKDSSYAITAAPRIAKGRVLIGNAGAEYPVRGYVSAYDAETGNLVWRSYTVPGDPSKPFESDAMKQAAATWSGEWWKAGGGGTVWEWMAYDPELDLVMFGTGNANPWYDKLRGKGDSLYVASIVAVHADTGEQAWHYQTTPDDNWDYDATQPLMLATLSIDGAQRRVVMQANKNGFFYVIDRENGKLISARPFAPVNWATGIDSNGRPMENPAARQLKDAALVQPSAEGAHNWNPMSFSPTTGLVYLAGSVRRFISRDHSQLEDEPARPDYRVRQGLPWTGARCVSQNEGQRTTPGLGSRGAKGSVARGPARSEKRRNAGHCRESRIPGAGGREACPPIALRTANCSGSLKAESESRRRP